MVERVTSRRHLARWALGSLLPFQWFWGLYRTPFSDGSNASHDATSEEDGLLGDEEGSQFPLQSRRDSLGR